MSVRSGVRFLLMAAVAGVVAASVIFLASRGRDKPPQIEGDYPIVVTRSLIGQGRRIWLESCAVCHGAPSFPALPDMPALATVDGKPWDYPDSLLDMMLVVKLIARSQHDFEGSENEARAVVAYMRTFWQVEIVTPEAAE